MVGCGEHAWSSHGPAQARYAATHPGIELLACADVDAERAARYASRFGFARSFADATAMLDADKPDAVALVVSETATPDLATAILERGLPVLIEKPPGRTAAEVDRLIAAADRGGLWGQPVPHQVAFNRRFAPLVREMRRRLASLSAGQAIQHVHYEMTRLDRLDPDFSITAIHGIDAVRYLAASDFAEVRFRYQEHPALGAGVANVFMDAVMASGTTAHLAFCPNAGVVVERAEAHAVGHSLFLQVPMWNAFDSPGRLQHLDQGVSVADLRGDAVSDGSTAWELGGFYAEYEAFLGDLAGGRTPGPSLREARQSVVVAEHIRERRSEYRA
jgi:myo-inositol 2-dehydrogenase / D-chiro-inositol 1-dehydrogenase